MSDQEISPLDRRRLNQDLNPSAVQASSVTIRLHRRAKWTETR